MKPVFAMMVTYKRFEHFKATTENLLRTLPKGSKLVIYDNNSDDERIKQYLYFMMDGADRVGRVDVHVILANRNEGWGTAMNEGLRLHPDWKEYEYVLETNNDVHYEDDWYEKSKALMEKYPSMGLLGLWSHPHHGVQKAFDDLLVKDNMPACAWLFRSKDLAGFLPFAERGACNTRGGNGEDTEMVLTVQSKGLWVCGARPDLAHHMDGYDIQDLGKENPAYLS